MESEAMPNSVDHVRNSAPRPRWMVVDDNEGIAEFLAALLENIGLADVHRFGSAEEALAAFKAQPDLFQFVITGLDLPAMDGTELCRKLHAITPEVKVVLAAGGGVINEDSARNLGFCGLLAKPFLVAQVCRLIEGFGVARPPMFSTKSPPAKNNNSL